MAGMGGFASSSMARARFALAADVLLPRTPLASSRIEVLASPWAWWSALIATAGCPRSSLVMA
eukprot:8819495-Pyramimonas_sp.AAC.1